MDNFISLDIETTGLDRRIDRVIEFGAVKFDLNGNSKNFQILINPGTKIPEFITYLTGITDEELKDAKTIEEAKNEIMEFIGDSTIIGHFVQFDIDFLKAKGFKIDNDYYDTSELARIFFPGLPSYSLEILSGILGLTHEEKHRALDDSIAAQELFFKIIEQIKSLPEDLHKNIINIASKSSWKFAETLKTIQADSKFQTTKSIIGINSTQNTSEADKEIIQLIEKAETTTFIETFNESQNLAEKIAETTANSLILLPKDLFEITKEEFKIRDPENKISQQRLEKFKERASFNPPETTGLIKTLIWLKEGASESLHDIGLNQDERQIIQHIKAPKIDQAETTAHAQHSTVISEHHYIPQQNDPSKKYNKIIIFDALKFIENLQSKLGIFLSIKKVTEPINSLNNTEFKNKLETIFGLLENFIPTQVSEYNENYTVQKDDIESPTWKRIAETTQFLIQESQNFKDIISEETLPYLQDWKNILKELESTFIKPNFDHYNTVIQKNRNGEIFVRQIARTKLIREEFLRIKDQANAIILVGKALDEGTNGTFIKSILGIENQDNKIKIEKITAPEEIIKTSQIFTVNDISRGQYENPKETTEFIKNFLKQEKGQSVIIFNSGKKLDQTHQILAPKLKKEGINMFAQKSSGGSGKITEMYKKSPATSSILITPNKWESFDHNALTIDEDFKTLIVHQIPFDPPSDPFINALSSGFSDQWKEFGIPSAVLQLKKIIGKFLYKTPGRIIILDSRILEKSYSSEFMTALNEFAIPTQVSSQELLKIL